MIASTCTDCGSALREVRFREGNVWTIETLVCYGKRKHGRVLCMDCYRRATAANRERGVNR